MQLFSSLQQQGNLTHLHLWCGCKFKILISEQMLLIKFMSTFCAIRQQTIAWTNVDQIIWCHMASQSHNELIKLQTKNTISTYHVLAMNFKAGWYPRPLSKWILLSSKLDPQQPIPNIR